MNILGISALYHDSAASLVSDGKIVAAAQEERFTRVKGDASFPVNAIRYCLNEAGITLDDVSWVGYYDKPLATFDRLIETYLENAPRGYRSFSEAMPMWLKEKLWLQGLLLKELNKIGLGKVSADKLLFGSHHHSHAASAFFPSPFRSAAILTADGVGEWATTTLGRGSETSIDLLSEIRFPHSLGLLYSAFTYYLGFKVNEGEYKVMGLAPYGEPRHVDRIFNELIDLKADGSFRLNMNYFDYAAGLRMTNERFNTLFDGHPPRNKDAPLERRHMDIARSIQVVIEEAMLRLARTLHRITGERNLCLAGGVALNCVANGRILREGPYEDIWVQPAAGDAGGAIGVALSVAHFQGGARVSTGKDGMASAFLGPQFGDEAIRACLDARGAKYRQHNEAEIIDLMADALTSEKVVGCFRGRMEFGPRSLGNRSILASACSPRIQRDLNMRVKYRESFRPFAPIVRREDVARYFELEHDSPYMLLVAPVRAERRLPISAAADADDVGRINDVRSDIPAVTHIDYSARIQTVESSTHPFMYRLLTRLNDRTGFGILVNTSMNVRDEPIVCTPEDAYGCFMGTEMDMLVMENVVLLKEDQ